MSEKDKEEEVKKEKSRWMKRSVIKRKVEKVEKK